MSEYQEMILRFLRMVNDNPHWDHRHTEPEPTWYLCRNYRENPNKQRKQAYREFYRLDYTP